MEIDTLTGPSPAVSAGLGRTVMTGNRPAPSPTVPMPEAAGRLRAAPSVIAFDILRDSIMERARRKTQFEAPPPSKAAVKRGTSSQTIPDRRLVPDRPEVLSRK